MDKLSKGKLKKILVANRGEIAIRVFRAATELGLRTVAIYSEQDRFALHRFKADESYLIGAGKGPVQAYMGIQDILRIADAAEVDCIHPGYGFLSENPDFCEAVGQSGIRFIGPDSAVMRMLGNKIEARQLAARSDVPVMPASGPLPESKAEIEDVAEAIGYPLMLKASWGGGGRGMRLIDSKIELIEKVRSGKREARASFGNDEVYFEKFLPKARHIEVQVLGDLYGNLIHLFERDCSMQRRNQKVVERAPADYLSQETRAALCGAALRLLAEVSYSCAGTVEFLMDYESGEFFFIEVNPRIQVEHTVTEEVTGIDLVKAQIKVVEGCKIGDTDGVLPGQESIKLNGHALQCRVTTEDPEERFIPDHGRITAYRGATGFGIRLDGGTAYSGAIITPYYDSLLEKVTAWAPTAGEAAKRMDRALREFRIRGVKTNLIFLEALVGSRKFQRWDYTTRFIDETPELLEFPKRRDRATRLLSFLANVVVNGNPEVVGRELPEKSFDLPHMPSIPDGDLKNGTRNILRELGPQGLSNWLLEQERLLVTDTTLRDAHQSLLATRLRTHDMLKIAPFYARALPELFSIECWGGATFDVAMRFLKEDPWDRLVKLRQAFPNILTQMLLRSANAVGYKNYPDNVVQYFITQSAQAGIDVFRVFDCLNWIDNMRVAIDAVCNEGSVCEGAICYTGDLTSPDESQYTLSYYVKKAKQLEASGVHILGIKDMAGLCKPLAARQLVTALKQEIGIPIHFHTHDTSGIAGASVLAAAEAGVDAVDAAMDSMSGLTSQPNLGAIAEALRSTHRDPGLDRNSLRSAATYWEGVRRYYFAFESTLRSGMSEVYEHAMPGGQYTNLREQALALGITESRWPEVSAAYAQVNEMFGDIVKVTPTSKVVGDLAIYMVTNDLTPEHILDPDRDVAFPESVVELMRGDLGQPDNGWPQALQEKVLKGHKPLSVRPGELLESVDLDAARAEVQKILHRQIDDRELASYLMYPRVFIEYAEHRRAYSDVSVIPTPSFFYGPSEDDELSIDIELGKTLIVRRLAVGEANDDGERSVFFELNGQPRTTSIVDHSLLSQVVHHPKADESNPSHVASPMPGMVVSISVKQGDAVAAGDRLAIIEAMKMETAVYAEVEGKVLEVVISSGTRVESRDLLMTLEVK